MGEARTEEDDAPKPADKPNAEKTEKPAEAPKLEIGKAAPAFELKDLDGKTVKLADFKGKVRRPRVVQSRVPGSSRGSTTAAGLKDCAAKATKDGVVWLGHQLGRPGHEGNGVEKNKKGHRRLEEWSTRS
jgi:hypothetical protein